MIYRITPGILVASFWLAGSACSSATGGSGAGGNSDGSGGASSESGGAQGGGTGGATGGATGVGGGLSTGGTTSSGSSASSGGAKGSGGISSAGGASGGTTGSSGSSALGGSAGSSGSTLNTTGPCDLYATANTPCVAAFSTIRVLLHTYKGPLYQVRKGGTNNVFKGNQPAGTGGGTTGGTTQDIGFTDDGFADSAAQDTFCGTATCTFSKFYDQSGKGNDLIQAPAGTYEPGPDYEVPASHSVTVGGHKVYAVYFPNPPSLPSGSAPSGYGYRNNKTVGISTGSAAQGVYMLADGTHAGNACCFDFGNAETNNGNGPTGAMAAVNLGTSYWGQGAGSAPWFEGDFEAGVWAGGSACGTPGSGQLTCNGRKANPDNPSMKGISYALGILKTGTTNNSPQYTLKVADATKGTLTTAYSGTAPGNWALQGAVLLGTGGDNSNSAWGTFYEGAITAGQPSDATDDAVAANIAAAAYGK